MNESTTTHTSNWRIERPADAGHLLVHVPHSSIRIPASERAGIVLDDDELASELLKMTHWHTDLIAQHAASLSSAPVTIFANALSRLVVDPERFPDEREMMLAVGMGAVYTRTSHGGVLRLDNPERRDRLIADYFTPYAEALADEVDSILQREGRRVSRG